MAFTHGSAFSRIDLLGVTAGFLSLAAVIPQIIKSWYSKSTEDISLLALSISTCSSCLWFTYGLVRRDKALIISNSVGMILGSTLILIKLYHG